MRVAQLKNFGEMPVTAPVDDPEPGADEALLRVHLSALNPFDLRVASGAFYIRPTLPYVPGGEGVGVVVRSRRWAVGTRVRFGPSARPGAFAELVAVPDDQLVAVPDGVADSVAAGIGVAGLAAWLSLAAGRLGTGERVLVLGATGVVGRLAVQLARTMGAGRIVAAGRDLAALARLGEFGADASVALDGRDPEALAQAIVDAAEGHVHVILDLLWGAPALAGAMAAATGARLVNVGDSAGPTIALPAALLRSRRLEVHGYTNLAVPLAEQHSALTSLLRSAERGQLRLDHEILPLDRLAEAWSRQAESPHRKLLVQMR